MAAAAPKPVRAQWSPQGCLQDDGCMAWAVQGRAASQPTDLRCWTQQGRLVLVTGL